ncbi:MAG: thioredoxin domain-containing protein, partial [Caldilineaceae bacterium]|nr:thioredoxin domain-containing protein [Caldilineaceae bacterium]
ATFTTCVTQQTHSQEVQDSVNQAIAQGFPGTPTILVNGQMLDSLDYDTLNSAVNAALAQAGN